MNRQYYITFIEARLKKSMPGFEQDLLNQLKLDMMDDEQLGAVAFLALAIEMEKNLNKVAIGEDWKEMTKVLNESTDKLVYKEIIWK